MASSRLISAGETYTPGDINNLRADVLDPVGGHKHDGADGARVPFANLDVVGAAGSTAPPGGSKSYNDIANHVASSQGAHGLNALAHVIGGAASGLLVQTGYVARAVTPGGQEVGTVSFPISFSGAPHVIGTVHYGSGPSHYMAVAVHNVTTAGFGWVLSTSALNAVANAQGFYWMAVGVKTP